MSSSDAGKDKFCDSIENIKKGVKDNLDKLDVKKGDEKVSRDELIDRYNGLMEKQRAYFKAVKEFQDVANSFQLLLTWVGMHEE